jgi:hypothetical protein
LKLLAQASISPNYLPLKMRIFLIILLLLAQLAFAQPTPYEKGNGNQTTTHAECIAWYQALAKAQRKMVKIDSVGITDSGRPLHRVVISTAGFDSASVRKKQRAVVFINNGIHPGEPEGIDASMALARALVTSGQLRNLLEQITVVIVPIYNVDGSLRRNHFTRANQNGPEAYGFRGNAQNLDLNRDFIKLDSRNAQSFVRLFRHWDPDLYLETHTTNGADYQHVMTLIETQKDKLRPEISGLMHDTLTPALYSHMESVGFPMAPYVNTRGELLESGIETFIETPRYGSGYAALFHTVAYVLETHMLKAYGPRYQATYELLQTALKLSAKHRSELLEARARARTATATASQLPINWQVDTNTVDGFFFRGYAARYKKSEVHGGERLYYDREVPWEAPVAWYAHALATDSVEKPKAYVVPQAWHQVIDRLQGNRVPMQPLLRDTIILTQRYKVRDYKTASRPYEGHYLHYGLETETVTDSQRFFAGDWYLPMGHGTDRFVVEVLEPKAVDSYFNWNFFDAQLQQKEYFSSYVFEDTAAELLRKDAALRNRFDNWVVQATAAGKTPSARAQLDWIYRESGRIEPGWMVLPVGRIMP